MRLIKTEVDMVIGKPGGVRQPTNEKTRQKIKGNAKQTVRQKANLKSIK